MFIISLKSLASLPFMELYGFSLRARRYTLTAKKIPTHSFLSVGAYWRLPSTCKSSKHSMVESAREDKSMGRYCLWPATWRWFKRYGTSSFFIGPVHGIRVQQSLGSQNSIGKPWDLKLDLGVSASYDSVNNTSSLNLKNVLFVAWGVMLLGWASGCLRSEDKHWPLILLLWLPLNHVRGLWDLKQRNFSHSSMIPSLSLPEGLWRIFSRLQLQRGCLRSVRETGPSPGVRLNKTVKSIGLHFSQGSLRRLRSSRTTGPYSLHVL